MRARGPGLALCLAWLFAAPVAAWAKPLDNFDSIAAWSSFASDQVTASLRQGEGVSGKALCLAYDFNGVSGYAVAKRKLPMDYPANYEYAIKLRGAAPANNLEFKLTDASGENVWWLTRPNYVPSADWTELKLKKRQISFAWGPTADKILRHTEGFEITVSAGKGGGRGELCFDYLEFRELPADDAAAPAPVVHASKALKNYPASNVLDGHPDTAWRAPHGAQSLTLDLGRSREFGGLSLHWREGEQASRYRLQASDDGEHWRELRAVSVGNGGADPIALPEAETRWLRLLLDDGPGANYGLDELTIEPLAFATTPNDFLKAVAKLAPRGRFPRGFSGEQPYWTIVGIDGGSEQGLIGEDGAIEAAKGGFSVEPFLISESKLIGWADVRSTQSLADGYLPIPSVDWQHADAQLRITAFAQGSPAQSQLVARYRLRNPTAKPRDYTLALALRPLQVNPPSQFLNTVGGVSPIHALAIAGAVATVDGKPRVFAAQAPDTAFATSFDAGMVEEHLLDDATPRDTSVADDTGLASGALLYRIHLAAGESREIDLLLPLSGEPIQAAADFDAQSAQDAVAGQWRDKLGRVQLQVPAQGRVLVDTLRTALANMLISRVGPRLQPGTRSYARAWIRDGAMISEGLLRLGQPEVAEQFLRWYAPYQFASGKVPCCVDDRGSDPVPENDSQGELIYTVAELYRYGGDRNLLAAMWPHVQGAVRYMDQLRLSERTEANRAIDPAFYGVMPASISHEGYSAKPMHSYWDDFWSLRGYKDAVEIAKWLGHDQDAKAFAASRDQFRDDLYASLQLSTTQHKINFLPGAAELGDFDATSTTIALAPGGEQGRLPDALLRNTFERYWREFVERRDGKRNWDYYTPYELRTVGAFVRLGWRERVMESLDFFFADRQPVGWNQWAEVVAREPRKPFFLGDLPHAWVGSDYVRSVLDMFAYVRESDQSLVIAAGIPDGWLEGEGIAVGDLRTPYGKLSYALRRENGTTKLHVDAGLQLPPGGIAFAWPVAGMPGQTRINGKSATWQDGELRIRRLPTDIQIDAGK
jgi:hypothetical protein